MVTAQASLQGNLSFMCFSMFVYIRCLFHSALVGQNMIAQLRGAKRSTEGGKFLRHDFKIYLLSFLPPEPSHAQVDSLLDQTRLGWATSKFCQSTALIIYFYLRTLTYLYKIPQRILSFQKEKKI